MMRYLAWLIAFLLVLSAGVAQGWLTDRWSLSNEPAASAAKLDGLPMQLGEWEGTDQAMDSDELALAEIVGYKLRSYRHLPTGRVAKVLIACGRPGPLAVHTPDVCLSGMGFVKDSEKLYTPPKEGWPEAKFKVGLFVREAGPTKQHQRIFWSWSADGNWSVPDNPRLTFARCPALFKLYVSYPLARPDELRDTDPYLELIRLLLIDLHDRLALAS
jgi:hypothetical protein